MKKLIVSALIGLTALAGTAHADPHNRYGYAGGYYGYPGGYRGPGYGYGHGGYHSHGGDWIAPALIGGIIGYTIAQPRYVAPPTVIYQQAPTVIPGPTQIPPVGYHYEDFYDGACNCYRVTLVRNY